MIEINLPAQTQAFVDIVRQYTERTNEQNITVYVGRQMPAEGGPTEYWLVAHQPTGRDWEGHGVTIASTFLGTSECNIIGTKHGEMVDVAQSAIVEATSSLGDLGIRLHAEDAYGNQMLTRQGTCVEISEDKIDLREALYRGQVLSDSIHPGYFVINPDEPTTGWFVDADGSKYEPTYPSALQLSMFGGLQSMNAEQQRVLLAHLESNHEAQWPEYHPVGSVLADPMHDAFKLAKNAAELAEYAADPGAAKQSLADALHKLCEAGTEVTIHGIADSQQLLPSAAELLRLTAEEAKTVCDRVEDGSVNTSTRDLKGKVRAMIDGAVAFLTGGQLSTFKTHISVARATLDQVEAEDIALTSLIQHTTAESDKYRRQGMGKVAAAFDSLRTQLFARGLAVLAQQPTAQPRESKSLDTPSLG